MSLLTRLRRSVAGMGVATLAATVVLAAGFTASTATSAQAHTGDMRASAVCNPQTGDYDVTYTLALRDVPQGQTGSTKWHIGGADFVNGWSESSFSWEGGPKEVAGNGTVTFTQTLPGDTKTGPWVYAFTKWSPDGFTVKSDTRVEGLNGDCSKPPPPFNHDWKYDPPTCEGLTVHYPENIPDGQANDANIRVKNLATGEVRTFNFHNNTGTWSGTKTFNVKDHPDWPGWTWFEYQWTQVAGTNYHWEGSVECGEEPPPPPVKPEPIVEKLYKEIPSCELGVIGYNGTKTIDTVFDEHSQTWIPTEPVITWDEEGIFVRDLTPAEKAELDCEKPSVPEPVTKPLYKEIPSCELGVISYNGTETTGWEFDKNTWTWVMTEPVIIWDKEGIFIRDLTVEEKKELGCEEPPVVVTPPDPKFQDLCGTEFDLVIAPAPDDLSYSVLAEKIDNIGRVVYHPNPGYAFPEGYNPVFTYTFTDDACPTEPPTEEPPVTPPPTDPPTEPEPTDPPTTPPVTTPPTETPTLTVIVPVQTPAKAGFVPVSKQPAPKVPAKSQATLAETGADMPASLVGLALGLTAVGGAALALKRRRTLQDS